MDTNPLPEKYMNSNDNQSAQFGQQSDAKDNMFRELSNFSESGLKFNIENSRISNAPTPEILGTQPILREPTMKESSFINTSINSNTINRPQH
jgi:hypothetical protein